MHVYAKCAYLRIIRGRCVTFLRDIRVKLKWYIICLQETWIFNFHQFKINSLFPQYENTSKSIDDKNPIPMKQLPRGFGGTSTLWKKSFNKSQPIEDGSWRTTVLFIGKMAIVNCYLPCRGSYTLAEYEDEIDQLNEICQKLQHMCLIVTGDFNTDFNTHDASRTSYLKKFLNDNKLEENHEIESPTFKHHSGNSNSKIDYIFLNRIAREQLSNIEYSILSDDAINTSSHQPLIMRFDCPCSISNSSNDPNRKMKPQSFPIWKKCDIDRYDQMLEDLLKSNPEPQDTSAAIDYLTQAILSTTKKTVPHKKKTTRKKPWNPAIGRLIKESKEIDALWKEQGKPGNDNILFTTRKKKRKELRQAQRQQAADNRKNDLSKLMEASSNDTKVFFQIIRQQRSTSSINPSEIDMEEWITHFSNLSKPSAKSYFDSTYVHRCNSTVKEIKDDHLNIPALSVPITKFEIHEAIMSLKKGKAADIAGLTAEHLQIAPFTITEFLAPVVNEIINSGKMPLSLKQGIITPVHKKGKPKDVPGNYRGITVTPLIGKIIDKITYRHQYHATNPDHPLQFGFTSKKSGNNAAFILSEAIAEAQDNKLPIYVASLDVEKAFDVVNHNSLLCKLHKQGLSGLWWNLKADSFVGMTSTIKCNGKLSKSFPIMQGTRQGAIPSPGDYKSYLLDLLIILQMSNAGFHIGSTSLSCPTCADDLILTSNNFLDMHVLLNLVNYYANREQYNIHPVKSVILPINLESKEEVDFIIQEKPWEINQNAIPVRLETTHLGIVRNVTNCASQTVDNRISTARKTIYALMGAGLHGLNGLPVNVSIHLFNIYVIPRLLYGL